MTENRTRTTDRRAARPRRWSTALPYIRRYAGKTIVVKYGGHAMGDDAIAEHVRRGHRAAEAGRHRSGRRAWRRAADRRHAGAAQDQELVRRRPARHRRRRRSRSSRWCCPARSTSRSSPRSTRPAAAPSAFRARTPISSARGSSSARRRDPDSNIEKVLDLGFVGEPTAINPEVLELFEQLRHHPGDRADRRRRRTARPTTSMPTRWRARSRPRSRPTRFLLLTDVDGVLDQDKKLITELTRRGGARA